MTLDEWCMTMYLNFLENGWTMSDIDELDVLYWIKLCEYKEKEEERKARLAFLARPAT